MKKLDKRSSDLSDLPSLSMLMSEKSKSKKLTSTFSKCLKSINQKDWRVEAIVEERKGRK
jgi:hypothetical protein